VPKCPAFDENMRQKPTPSFALIQLQQLSTVSTYCWSRRATSRSRGLITRFISEIWQALRFLQLGRDFLQMLPEGNTPPPDGPEMGYGF
jgi:hypothetical protein